MPRDQTALARPPAQLTQQQIQKMARRLEQMMARRRRLVKQLRVVDQEVRAARRLLRDVIADATAPVDHEAEPDEIAPDARPDRPKRPRRTKARSPRKSAKH